jgi:hypothetical protein
MPLPTYNSIEEIPVRIQQQFFNTKREVMAGLSIILIMGEGGIPSEVAPEVFLALETVAISLTKQMMDAEADKSGLEVFLTPEAT